MPKMRAFKKDELLPKIHERGKTQATFAYVAGVSPSTIFKACQGQDLSPSVFARISSTLGNLPVLNGSQKPRKAS